MIRKIISNIKLSGNKKNIAKISSGNIIGQVISMATIPMITRIYGAEIIGLWSLLNSIALIINSYSDFGLTNSIMTENNEEDVEKKYKVISTLSALICIVSSIIVTLFYFLFADEIEISYLLFFAFLAVLSVTLQQIQICYTWLNRKGNYNVLMKNPLVNNSVYGILAIVFGLLGSGIYGYFIAHLLGQIITLIHMKRNLPAFAFTFRLSDYINIFKRDNKFISYQLPTNVIGKFKEQLPSLLIKSFWGTKVLGYYSITLKVINIPSSLLASAIGRVFFQTVTKMIREGKTIGEYVYNNMKRAMKIAVIPMSLFMAFCDVATIILLGTDWRSSGEFLRVLALRYLFVFIMNTVQGITIALNKQNYALISLICQIVSCSASLVAGRFIFNNIIYAFIFMTISSVIINIVFFGAIFKAMGIPKIKYIKLASFSVGIMFGLSFILRSGFDMLGLTTIIYKIFGIY